MGCLPLEGSTVTVINLDDSVVKYFAGFFCTHFQKGNVFITYYNSSTLIRCILTNTDSFNTLQNTQDMNVCKKILLCLLCLLYTRMFQ